MQTENQRLKNELVIAHSRKEEEDSLFQTSVLQWFDEKYWHIFVLESTMESIFYHLEGEFEDKSNLVDDSEAEVKSLSSEDIDGFMKKIGRLEV